MIYEVAYLSKPLLTLGPKTLVVDNRTPRIGSPKFKLRTHWANEFGITVPGGTGPVVPTYGQIFPSGR